jgi:hypothetical protein
MFPAVVKRFSFNGHLVSFAGKNMWRCILILMFLVPSCGLYEIGGSGADSSHAKWGNIPDVSGGHGTSSSVCYMTVVEYKRGYDWRSDQAGGSVKCSLAVYADGVPVMKIPAGDQYEVSSDPDMHRIIEGHLYTDWSTDTETVIKKDGQTLFRYQGRESICGMEVIDNHIYTLGLSRNGSGFAFRKDGDVVLSRSQGCIIGSMVNDRDSLCFAFYENIRNAEGNAGRYYVSVSGKVFKETVRDDIRTLWDIMPHKDNTVCLVSLVGTQSPVIISGDSMTGLVMPLGSSMLSCRLFDIDGETGVEGVYRLSNGTRHSAIWLNGKIVTLFPKDRAISAFKVQDKGIICVVNPETASEQGMIYNDGEVYDMPSGYSVIGNNAIEMKDGILHVGLSSMEGRCPLVWKDGHTDSLRVNGYISSIRME